MEGTSTVSVQSKAGDSPNDQDDDYDEVILERHPDRFKQTANDTSSGYSPASHQTRPPGSKLNELISAYDYGPV